MIQGIGLILVGVMFLLVGLGKARVSKNAGANAAFVKKWGVFFLIAGPIIALTGVVKLVGSL